MSTVIRIDDEVMAELKKRAVEYGLVFQPPNSTLRIVLGLDIKTNPEEAINNSSSNCAQPNNSPVAKEDATQKDNKDNSAVRIKDMVTGQVYASKEIVGMEFSRELSNIAAEFRWYALIRKYPGRFVEEDTGQLF